MLVKKVHLRDKNIPRIPIHYLIRSPKLQLTDDPEAVTCGTCLRMMKRQR